MNRPACRLGDADRGIDVVDTEIDEPDSRHLHAIRPLHDSRDAGLAGMGDPVVERDRVWRPLEAPTDDIGVEGLGRVRIGRDQLVPDGYAGGVHHRLSPARR